MGTVTPKYHTHRVDSKELPGMEAAAESSKGVPRALAKNLLARSLRAARRAARSSIETDLRTGPAAVNSENLRAPRHSRVRDASESSVKDTIV